MKRKHEFVDTIGIILLTIGLVSALSPHITHIGAWHPASHTHEKEIFFGLATLILGLGTIIVNNKSLKFWKD